MVPNMVNLFVFSLHFSLVLSGNCFWSDFSGYLLSDSFTCLPGFYCPKIVKGNITTLPVVCPTSVECQITRLAGFFCNSQGLYEPQVCLTGYYCPNFLEMYECPEGYFCPLGTVTPIRCPTMSVCDAGSGQRIYYLPIVVCIVVDFFVFFLAAAIHYGWFVKTYELIMINLLKRPLVHASDKSFQLNNVILETPVIVSPRKLSNLRGSTDSRIAAVNVLASNFIKANSEIGRKAQFNVEFSNLKVVLPNDAVILAGVTGFIRAGKVTAVMGPSGAGKTTFINCMMGKISGTGKIKINGVLDEIYKYKDIFGYVPQDDEMIRELSVYENISHSAKIRLPVTWSDNDKEIHVQAVMSALGISSVASSLIGDNLTRGISGGQRKRCNIGIELAAAPLALFLDEPTSGLDSTSALEVCDTLKRVAVLGLTIVAVIHQPRIEIFDTFDDLVLLSPGGFSVYVGPTSHVQEYFESLGYQFSVRQNFADQLMDVIVGSHEPTNAISNEFYVDGIFDLPSAWKAKGDEFLFKINQIQANVPSSNLNLDEKNEEKLNVSSKRGASFLSQVWLCHARSLLQQYRNLSSFALEIGVSLLAGGLMGVSVAGQDGALYQGTFKDTFVLLSPSPNEITMPQFGLFIAVSIGLAGAPAGVITFGEERHVYFREVSSGHSSLAYFLGKIIADFYRITWGSFHFISLFYVLATPIGSFWGYFLVILLLFYCVYGLAAIISMVVSRSQASLLAVICCLFAGVFSGYAPSLAQARSWGIDFILNISYARWSGEALFTLELLPRDHLFQIYEISAPLWGYELDRFGVDLLYMLLIGSVYRILSYVLMIFMDRNKQL